MSGAIRDVYETVHELAFASLLLVVAAVVGITLVVVSGGLYLLGVPQQTAGLIGAGVVAVAGFGAILYGGYTYIDWE